MLLHYHKRKAYSKRNAVLIGKERHDITRADGETIIRVTFSENPGIFFDVKRKELTASANRRLAENYPFGAWIIHPEQGNWGTFQNLYK